MFFIPELLQKKGPFALVWLAGTNPKLASNYYRLIQTTIIADICKQILESDIPLSLRLSSFLMCGAAFLYQQQNLKLYNDSTLKIKEINVAFDTIKHKKKRTKARLQDITLVNDNIISGSLWEDFTELDLDDSFSNKLITDYFPKQQKSNNLSNEINQASIDDITLPNYDELELQYENIDYNIQFTDDLIIHNESDIQDISDINNNPSPIHIPLNISSSLNYSIPTIPIPSQIEVPNEQQEIEEEDKLFLAEKTKTIQQLRRIRVDRRISLDAEEIRDMLENTEEYEIERPVYEKQQLNQEKNQFYNPSASFFSTNNDLLNTWNFMVFTMGIDDTYSTVSTDTSQNRTNNSSIPSGFLPELSGENDSFGRTVEELRMGAMDESVELNRGKDILATPYDYNMDTNIPQYQSTPIGELSPNLFYDKTSPLPHRRASSIIPSNISPLPNLQQYNEPISIISDVIIPQIQEPPKELISSINENSVKMLKFVRKQLKNSSKVEFSEITKDMNKSQASKAFFQLLVLSSTNYLDTLQTIPYGEITIREGDILYQ